LLRLPYRRLLLTLLFIVAGAWAASCASALGPGYTIETQGIRVRFESGPEPRIHVDSEYRLRNTGDQPLASLELRLPGRRRFQITDSHAAWDGAALVVQTVPANPRNTLLELPQRWKVMERHTLHLSAELNKPASGETNISFADDAFFLPSAGWAPELLPSQGLFPTGGVPPKEWRLVVRVPDGFLVHTSGRAAKIARHGRELTATAVQHPEDRYPFVVAGRYTETTLDAGAEKVFLWTRAPEESAALHQSADALVRTVKSFDEAFGNGGHNAHSFWLVECPVPAGCFTATASSYSALLNAEAAAVTSELVSADTLLMDLSGGAPKFAAAAPSLAASWLGYGQNPGFYEQRPPLSALPAFASALGREAIEGPSYRVETIRRALRMIPKETSADKVENPSVLRAKSYLFFFALQDRYGREIFQRAINHMLSARQGRGFNLSDLIAAFEQETNQNVAEFERIWMKRSGVPEDFRARYEVASDSVAVTSKETKP
jgi:hypothetical protein